MRSSVANTSSTIVAGVAIPAQKRIDCTMIASLRSPLLVAGPDAQRRQAQLDESENHDSEDSQRAEGIHDILPRQQVQDGGGNHHGADRELARWTRHHLPDRNPAIHAVEDASHVHGGHPQHAAGRDRAHW